MRKSIFDIALQGNNLESDAKRILKMSQNESVLCANGIFNYNLFNFVDEYCFNKWKHRGHFIDVDDYLNALNFKSLSVKAFSDIESLLTLIELIYNFWYLSNFRMNNDININWCGNYYHLKNVMDDVLAQYNHTIYIDEKNESVLVIEDKPEVTAVAEIVSDNIATKVIKYNHRALKGNVELKNEILFSLGKELESKRKELHQINSSLEDNIFYLMNKLNVRHNNSSENDKSKYVEYVANMDKSEIEEWYDELYQLILLAFLQLDNIERTKKIKDLKSKIDGGSN